MTGCQACHINGFQYAVPAVLTLLLSVQGLNLKEYVRLWGIPLFFILISLVQTNLYLVGDFTLANGFRIIIGLCAFVTY